MDDRRLPTASCNTPGLGRGAVPGARGTRDRAVSLAASASAVLATPADQHQDGAEDGEAGGPTGGLGGVAAGPGQGGAAGAGLLAGVRRRGGRGGLLLHVGLRLSQD